MLAFSYLNKDWVNIQNFELFHFHEKGESFFWCQFAFLIGQALQCHHHHKYCKKIVCDHLQWKRPPDNLLNSDLLGFEDQFALFSLEMVKVIDAKSLTAVATWAVAKMDICQQMWFFSYFLRPQVFSHNVRSVENISFWRRYNKRKEFLQKGQRKKYYKRERFLSIFGVVGWLRKAF